MDRILGITAEYDPFHSGHAYQLKEAREQIRPAAVICVMSGDFTQRGEPAVLDKWTRARIAAQQGVDLVFELPFMYACNRAERFAAGAVDMLVSAGATHISFGCEAEQPEDLKLLVDEQLVREDQVEAYTADFMKEGYSRAKAAELASRKLFGDELTDLMLMPNNILALEYMKRIRWWEEAKGVQICSVPIRRFGSGYGAADPDAGFAGGSALRQMLAAGQDIEAYLPYEKKGLSWVDLPAARQRLYDLLRSIILRSTPEQLAGIYCVGEGMEHRLLKEARLQETYEGFLSAMVSRRYTAAAIRRIMLYILMNAGEFPVSPPYGRVLAANAAGRRLLRRLEDSSVPGVPGDGSPVQEAAVPGNRPLVQPVPPLQIIANANKLTGVVEPIRQALQLDMRAADMFHLITGREVDALSDYRRRPWME